MDCHVGHKYGYLREGRAAASPATSALSAEEDSGFESLVTVTSSDCSGSHSSHRLVSPGLSGRPSIYQAVSPFLRS